MPPPNKNDGKVGHLEILISKNPYTKKNLLTWTLKVGELERMGFLQRLVMGFLVTKMRYFLH